MAAGTEVRSNDSVYLHEPLGVSGGFESPHSPLPFTCRLMRILSQVVQVPMLSMSNAGHHHSFRRAVTAELVSNNDPGFAPSHPQQLAKETDSGKTYPASVARGCRGPRRSDQPLSTGSE